jgi:Beta/Gamma crystallin
MHTFFHAALAAAALALAAPALAQITFYEHEGFRGRAHTTAGALDSFAGWSFNDRASSVVVDKGRWEVCEGVGFSGRCALLSPGAYDRLGAMGLNDRLSSVRPAQARVSHDNEASPPMRRPDYAYRQRPRERLFEVPVSSVRAVLGAPEQRCWVEHQPGQRDGGSPGRGVIGHQTGRSAVRRCEQVSNDTPAFWEVSYSFRGQAHRIQMDEPPGRTITVNRAGEPRM